MKQRCGKVNNKNKLSDLAGVLPVKRKFPGLEKEQEITKQKVAQKVARHK